MHRKPHLRLAITNRCNLSCIYCRPGGEGTDTNIEMSTDEILSTLKIASESGFRHLKITGGEPLLRQETHGDLFEISHAIKKEKHFETVDMVTNGTLLGEYINKLNTSGLDGLTVSLDAADKVAYHYMTGNDHYKTVLSLM